MGMIDSGRRKVVASLLSCGTCCALPRLALAQLYQLPPYCAMEAGFDISRLHHLSSSGNRALDRAMIVELKRVNHAFAINPGYRYFDDHGGGNALALQRTLIRNTRGTILFGLRLVTSELGEEFGGAAVAGIAAHEGAHILQFFSHFIHRLAGDGTARSMELHADFLAGYYFGVTGRTDRSIDAFGSSLFAKGDYNYNDPGHHGTPDERLDAMHLGYREASRGTSLMRAVEVGIAHVAG